MAERAACAEEFKRLELHAGIRLHFCPRQLEYADSPTQDELLSDIWQCAANFASALYHCGPTALPHGRQNAATKHSPFTLLRLRFELVLLDS